MSSTIAAPALPYSTQLGMDGQLLPKCMTLGCTNRQVWWYDTQPTTQGLVHAGSMLVSQPGVLPRVYLCEPCMQAWVNRQQTHH